MSASLRDLPLPQLIPLVFGDVLHQIFCAYDRENL